MTDVVLLAAYRLPLPLTLDSEALSVVFPSRVGGVPAEVLFPPHQDEDETLDADDVMFLRAGGRDRAPDRVLTVVNAWEGARRGPDGSGDLAWHPRAPSAASKQARRLYLRILSDGLELGRPRVGVGASLSGRAGDALLQGLNQWHRTLRSWVEVYTTQDLDHENPRWTAEVEGGGLATFRPDGTRLGIGGRVRVFMHDEPPASAQLVAKALKHAGEDKAPLLQYTLLRDGRAAWHRKQYRRAVIDAATACEVALVTLAQLVGWEGKRLSGIHQRVEALIDADALPAALGGNIRAYINKPRNAAVHEGVIPGPSTAGSALRVAEATAWYVCAPDGSPPPEVLHRSTA